MARRSRAIRSTDNASTIPGRLTFPRGSYVGLPKVLPGGPGTSAAGQLGGGMGGNVVYGEAANTILRTKPQRGNSVLDALLGRGDVGQRLPSSGNLAAPMYNTSDIPSASFKVNPSLTPTDGGGGTGAQGRAGASPSSMLGTPFTIGNFRPLQGTVDQARVNEQLRAGLPPYQPAQARPYTGALEQQYAVTQQANEALAALSNNRLPVQLTAETIANMRSQGMDTGTLSSYYTLQPNGVYALNQQGAQVNTQSAPAPEKQRQFFGYRGDKWRVDKKTGATYSVRPRPGRGGGGGSGSSSPVSQWAASNDFINFNVASG